MYRSIGTVVIWWMNLEKEHVLGHIGNFSPRMPAALHLLRFGEDKEGVKDILLQRASNTIDIQSSVNHHKLSTLQASVPVMSDFICKCPKNLGNIPDDVCAVIKYKVEKIEATFTLTEHPKSSYGATTEISTLYFFPSLPPVRGPGRYQAGQKSSANEEDSCRKVSYGHPTLTPGIFTILYCTHGVCYGFEIM